jgi:hypothetical protein
MCMPIQTRFWLYLTSGQDILDAEQGRVRQTKREEEGSI